MGNVTPFLRGCYVCLMVILYCKLEFLHCTDTVVLFNPNKRGIGEKSPTFVQNNFTSWCLRLNIFVLIWYGSQIVWHIFFNLTRTSWQKTKKKTGRCSGEKYPILRKGVAYISWRKLVAGRFFRGWRLFARQFALVALFKRRTSKWANSKRSKEQIPNPVNQYIV